VPTASVVLNGPACLSQTLSPLRRGGQDPTFQTVDGVIWRTSLMRTGPATARLSATAHAVECEAWGNGAAEFIDLLPKLVGAQDDAGGFHPDDPTLAEAYRRVPHLRLCSTGRVLEALIPAVIEQRVSGLDAWTAWRRLVVRFGAPAPGPSPTGMRVPPMADVWRRIPSWEFHRANVDPGRARTIVGCAQRADSLERLDAVRARHALLSLPGVGEWTVAETLQRAFGDADALSVGDYHLAKMVGWTLLGHPIDDAAMVDLLEPVRPHRHRAVRVLAASGLAHNPRFGARQAIPRLREL
jgi:3-methyladenine DNA glycosylase/8-oxoguanine DNA glycosylase